jgi:hypothetical protein
MNKYLVKLSWESTGEHYVKKMYIELYIWAMDMDEAKKLAAVTLWETDIKNDLLDQLDSHTVIEVEDVT